jgi:hypothetical protein
MKNIDFPYHIDNRGRTAITDSYDKISDFQRWGHVALSGYEKHILDMIEQLLFTSPGERVNRPEFGSGLLTLIFSSNSPELAAAMQSLMQAAIERWLGDLIEIQALDVTSEDSTLRITVQYWVRLVDEQRTVTFERSVTIP